MKYSDLTFPENCKGLIEKVDSLRGIYDSIKFEEILSHFN